MNQNFGKKIIRPVFMLFFAMLMLICVPVKASAAEPGFQTSKGKTYYIKADGTKQRGWLKLNGHKYYFNTKTGVMTKGWQYNSKGQKVRYFTSGKGVMATGFLTDSAGNTRYFDPSTGIMCRGWMKDKEGNRYYFTKGSGVMLKGWVKVSGKKRYFSKSTGRMAVGWMETTKGNYRYFEKKTGYMFTGLKVIGRYRYYFSKTNGIRYQKGFSTVSGRKYYFNPSNGRAHTGWLTLDGKSYYFSAKGIMYANRTLRIDGKDYVFDREGVAEAKSSAEDKTVSVYDQKNGRSYTVMREYLTHPGVENGEKTDLDLLAAFCESEAGDQGEAGMEAVALCLLNRTIKRDKEFPSSVRLAMYHGTTFPQYSVVTNGALEKRLKGQFENRTLAYKAAGDALEIFRKYVTDGTKRRVKGFKTKDFNYMYFMMESYFWKQPLNFDKVKYVKYKDHIFFVDWV